MHIMTMNTDRAQAASRHTSIGSMLAFITLWTLMTLSAGALARPLMLFLTAPWGGLLAGAITGLLQWALLGNTIRDSALWVAATASGLAAASLLQGTLAPAAATILGGAALGLAQWLVLRESIPRSAHWIVICAAIAWPAARAGLVAAGWLAARNTLLVAQILASALQGGIAGIATGILMVTLLPGQPPAGESSPPEAS